MNKTGKRMICFSLFFAMLLTVIPSFHPVYSASNDEEILFKKDFEEYAEGSDISIHTGDIYSSSTSHTDKTWTSVSADYAEVCTEADGINNKVHRLFNPTDRAVNASFSKMIRIGDSYTPRFSISFRVNPKGNPTTVRVRRYGGSNGSVEYLSMTSAGDVSVREKKTLNTQVNKWINVKLDICIPENTMVAYVDSQIVYMGEYLSGDYTEDNAYYNLEFISKLSPNRDAYWDDVVITSLSEATEEEETGNNLAIYKGVHPRILFDSDDFENMKKRTGMPEYQSQWNSLKERADKLVADGPVAYHKDSDVQELWMRGVATSINVLTFAYKLSGEEKYKDAATAYVKEVISYPTWGYDIMLNNDLAAGHLIQSLSYYYDWLYNDLDANERYVVYRTLIEKVPQLNGWWTMSYVQNHLWRNAGSIYAAAAAIYDEYEGAQKWFSKANQMYRLALKYLPTDGCNHESFMYWVYGIDAFIDYAECAKKFHKIDIFKHPYLQRTANYAMQVILPTAYNGTTQNIFRIADHGDKTGTEWIGVMAWLAYKTKDPVTQWYVNKYAKLNPDSWDYALHYLQFYDPQIAAASPEEAKVPLIYRFDDLEMLFMRDSYSDSATCLTYRCGPPLGHQVLGYYSSGDVGSGHDHDDVNSLQIYAHGEDLLGETLYGGSASASHNTILIDGKGQEVPSDIKGAEWNKNGEIVKIEETDDYVYSVGRGTESYYLDKDYGFDWNRHFVWLKSDVMIVIDDVKLAKEDAVIEQRWWPESQNGTYNSDGSSTFVGNATKLKIRPFSVDKDTEMFYGSSPKLMGTGNSVSKLLVNVKDKGTSVIPTALSWSSLDGEPEEIGCEKISDDVYNFFTNDKKVTVDIKNMSVAVTSLGDGFKVRKNLLAEEFEVKPEEVNDRFYISQRDINALMDVPAEYDSKSGKLILGDDKHRAEMNIGDNHYTVNGKTIEMDAVPYLNKDHEAMFPVKYLGLCSGVGAQWDDKENVLYLTTGIDFENLELKAINVCNNSIELQKDVRRYEVNVFADTVSIKATAENPFADIRYEVCDGGFGESKIYVTNPDGSRIDEYTIVTLATKGIGDIPVYNMSYSSSDGNVGENVFDGDYATRWSATGMGQWLQMDLGSVKKIKSILVAAYRGDTRKTEFEIEVSDDNVNWKKVKTFMTSGITTEAEEYALDDIETRYLRFVGNGPDGGGGWTSISEIGLISAE